MRLKQHKVILTKNKYDLDKLMKVKQSFFFKKKQRMMATNNKNKVQMSTQQLTTWQTQKKAKCAHTKPRTLGETLLASQAVAVARLRWRQTGSCRAAAFFLYSKLSPGVVASAIRHSTQHMDTPTHTQHTFTPNNSAHDHSYKTCTHNTRICVVL